MTYPSGDASPTSPGSRPGKHESLSWQVLQPITDWMAHVQGMLYRILRNQEGEMATLADVNTAVDGLKTDMETALTELKAQADSGAGVSGDDLQALIDRLNGLHTEVTDTLSSVTPAPASSPSTPTDTTTPATPTDTTGAGA